MRRLILGSSFTLLLAVIWSIFAAGLANAAESRGARRVAPQSLRFDIPSLDAWVVFSHPAYRAQTVEETPYQMLQICRRKHGCDIVQDLGKGGGLSISSTSSLGFSPDRLYFIAYRLMGVDPTARSFRAHVYSIYGVKEREIVRFESSSGTQATTNNILDWSPRHPHALEIALKGQSQALAHPISP